MDTLNEAQRRALTQLQTLTNDSDEDTAISILDSVDWDVQRAAELIFDSSPPSVPPPTVPPRGRMEIDDSRQGEHTTPQPTTSSFRILQSPRIGSLWTLLVYPVHLFSNIFRFIFGVLRIPIPQLRFTGLNFHRPIRPGLSDPRTAAERWVRALEEETGGICISRASMSQTVLASGTDVGSSTLPQRSFNGVNGSDESKKLLPDFALSSYEDVLRTCQKQAKIACIVLVSEEHDDVAEFKRSTLTDASFVKLLHDNEIIVWGGDVRDQDAWSAAQKLQVTTYPFVAFLALQPRRSLSTSASRSSSSPPTLTILSRHQGHSIPDSAPTSATTLTEHLERQLLPRVNIFLERIKATIRDREHERFLREEQDRAFRDSAQRDRQRIEAKMAEERKAEEDLRRKEEAAHAEEERRRIEGESLLKRQADRMDWRRWCRRALTPPDASGAKDHLRIAVRLPTGARIIRHFSPITTLTAFYAHVDSQLIPEHLSAEDDPQVPPLGSASGEAAIECHIAQSGVSAEEWWGFILVLAYPRHEIRWAADTTLRDINGLKGGVQIVVEMVDKRARYTADEVDVESDGYSSESD